MKKYPRCKLNYSDNTLEFCLEDGAKLFLSQNFADDIPTFSNSNLTTAEIVNLSYSFIAHNI
jgi:hypothetical protein